MLNGYTDLNCSDHLYIPCLCSPRAVSAYSRALAREQLRCKYVSREVALMISLQDASTGSAGTRTRTASGLGAVGAGARAPSPNALLDSEAPVPPPLSIQRSSEWRL